MLRALVAIALGTMLCAAAPTSMALGLGRIDNATVLGQPLDFTAALNLQAEEFIAQECVSAEVSSGDNKLSPELVRVRLDSAPGASQATVRVQTVVAIDEPVVTVSLMVGCPPRLSRQFVAFIDPPIVSLPQTTAAPVPSTTTPAATGADGARVAAKRSPGVSTTPPRANRRAPPRRPGRSVAVARGPSVVTPAPRAAPSTRSTTNAGNAARNAPPAPGPRLMLDPPVTMAQADPIAAPAASAPSNSPPTTDSAAPAAESSAETERRFRERERLLGLEETLERMRRDNAATQKNLADLQFRLREAEVARRSNPAVYGLGIIVVLLLVAIAALLWRQSRMRRPPQWWSASEMQAARESMAPPTSQVAPDTATPRTVAGVLNMAPPAVRSPVVEAPPLVSAPTPLAESAPTATEVARRELSVEELIDLEQQADFFVVLGQDEAAIDLLMGHVRLSGGSSPMPYLKLLDIYRRRGEREAYERIRRRFNQRFNAYAPDWDTDPSEGRALEDYSEVMSRLQLQWGTPAQAMDLLESLLFRRDSSDSTFDLPAYGELLFLYSHARDLAEHDTESGGVDLLLPLGHSEDEAAFASLTGSIPLDVSEPPVQEPPASAPSVDFELDLGEHEQSAKS